MEGQGQVTLSEEQLKGFTSQLSAIQEKLKQGYDRKELEGIVADMVKDQMKVQRSSAPMVVEEGLPAHIAAKGFKFLHEELVDHDLVKEFQETSDEVYLLSKYLKTSPETLKRFQQLQGIVKAMSGGAAGSGQEWIPTGFSAQLYEKIRLQLKVAGLFNDVGMPTNPFKPPVLLGDAQAYLVPESTSDEVVTTATMPPTGAQTGAVTLTAKKIAARVRVSDEANEDSLVPMLDILKGNIALATAQAIENALINGDTAGSHMDNDVTNAKDCRKAWDGLRKLAPSGAKVDIATFNEAALRGIRKKMGVYGVNPASLAWVVGISGYIQMLGLTGVMTMEKYGPAATILQGELAKFDGAPVIVSEYIREDLNASGVYDNSTKTKTVSLLVNRNCFITGTRKGTTLAAGQDIENGQQILVASTRKAFSNIFADTQKVVGVGYNLTS